MITKTIPLLALTLLLTGCSEPIVDGSTHESMRDSIAKVRKSLPEAKRAEFDQSVQLIALNQIDLKSLFIGEGADAEYFGGKIRDAVHGKTGNQIIAEANRIKMERDKKQKRQALQEIEELEEKKINSAAAREQLKKFAVLSARFYKNKRENSQAQPIIELSVKNGTSHSISRVYFRGILTSPGRNVPWNKELFSYSTSTALEPGEVAEWQIAPREFSGWGRVNAPEDAKLTVTVERLYGIDGKLLFSANEFGEREEKRLTQLKEKYNMIEKL